MSRLLNNKRLGHQGGPASRAETLQYAKDGIIVVDHNGTRYLYFSNNLAQGAISLIGEENLLLDYQAEIQRLLQSLRNSCGQSLVRSICVAGLGAGTISRLVQSYFPNSLCTTCEISQTVIEIYQKYFFQKGDNFSILKGDACELMSQKEFDLFIMDINDPDNGFFDNFDFILKRQKKFIVNTQTKPKKSLNLSAIICKNGNYIVHNLT